MVVGEYSRELIVSLASLVSLLKIETLTLNLFSESLAFLHPLSLS